jgi:hypothetical protein
MIGKGRIYLILLFIFLSINMKAQISGQNDSTFELTPTIEDKEPLKPIKNEKLHLSLDVGAGVMGSKHFSGAYTYIAPNLSYLLTPKLKIEIGAAFISGNYNFYKLSNESSSKVQLKNDQLFLFTKGQYLLTNRLILSGTVYKTINTNASAQINPYFLDYKGMSVGLDYKISEHMSFGAQFNFSNGTQNDLLYQGGTGFSPVHQSFMGW